MKHKFGKSGRGAGEFSLPIAVCIFFDNIAVCDWHNTRIQIFSRGGEFIRVVDNVDEERFENPHAICTLGKNLLIADRYGRGVRVLDSSFHLIKSISVGQLEPIRVACTKSGFILVATWDNTVLVLNQDGNIIRQFGRNGSNIGKFNWIRGICSNSRGEIIVADYGNHRLQIFSRDGIYLRTIIGYHSKRLSGPIGVCTDERDNIFVADNEDNKVYIFDTNGKPIQEIAFSKPYGICLNGREIIVTSGDDFVGIFSN